MIIPRYWAKGPSSGDLSIINPRDGRPMKEFSCWGWSDISVEDARRKGSERADKIVAVIRSGEKPNCYLYGDSPMREEVSDEWKRDDGFVFAAVTTNSYGCLILNTTNVMFVDVDLPEVPVSASLGHLLRRLFGNKSPDPRTAQEAEAIDKVKLLVQRDPRCGVRIYRTRAGLRYIMTHELADPLANTTTQIMQDLAADPLYVRLCGSQQCFRARLTPKPWRCGFHALPVKYPWKDDQTRHLAARWTDEYRRKSNRHATCRFLDHLGAPTRHPEADTIVRFHDTVTQANSKLPLA